MAQQLRMACLCGIVAALVGNADMAAAASKAVGMDGPGGGELGIDWRDDGVWMTGPTTLVFEGRLEPDFLAGLA